MPTKKPIPEEPPSEQLVLAAIERATRHRRRQDDPGALFATVKQHLGLARGGWSTRRLRPTWESLAATGLIAQSRNHGITLWALTPAGARRLEAARRAKKIEPLPESPQHCNWREARSAAGEHVGKLRDELHRVLAEATELLDVEPPAGSDAWYEAGQTLQNAASRLGSATYCLSEWTEPDDARADIASVEHQGRRDYRRWAGEGSGPAVLGD